MSEERPESEPAAQPQRSEIPPPDQPDKVFEHVFSAPSSEPQRREASSDGYPVSTQQEGGGWANPEQFASMVGAQPQRSDSLDWWTKHRSKPVSGAPSSEPSSAEATEGKQEWTPLLHQVGLDIRVYAHDETSGWKYLVRLCDSEQSARLHTPRFIEAVNKEVERRINAALAAQDEVLRMRFEKAAIAYEKALAAEREKAANLSDRLDAVHRALDGVAEWEDGPVEAIQKLRQQLLAAQAAIAEVEDHNIRGVLSPVAIAKHDSEVIEINNQWWRKQTSSERMLELETSRQPLVDALEELLNEGFNQGTVHRAEIALAQVKEGKHE